MRIYNRRRQPNHRRELPTVQRLENRRLLSAALTTLNNFNGAQPLYSNLAVDPDGNLFGNASNGGANNIGMVYELSGSNHQNFTTLFSAGPETPISLELTFNSAGDLYAVIAGGAFGDGALCELTGPTHQTITILASFDGADGIGPTNLFADGDGNLYGTTYAGGDNGDGTVFELTTGTLPVMTTLCSLNAADQAPIDGVVADAAARTPG